MTRLVGLTGGIACGKSLVACNLGNIAVIDCDELARKCTKKVSALPCTVSSRVDVGLQYSALRSHAAQRNRSNNDPRYL